VVKGNYVYRLLKDGRLPGNYFFIDIYDLSSLGNLALVTVTSPA
jgi:hypothetical protein